MKRWMLGGLLLGLIIGPWNQADAGSFSQDFKVTVVIPYLPGLNAPPEGTIEVRGDASPNRPEVTFEKVIRDGEEILLKTVVVP